MQFIYLMCLREIVKSSFMYCSKSVDATVNQKRKGKIIENKISLTQHKSMYRRNLCFFLRIFSSLKSVSALSEAKRLFISYYHKLLKWYLANPLRLSSSMFYSSFKMLLNFCYRRWPSEKTLHKSHRTISFRVKMKSFQSKFSTPTCNPQVHKRVI